VTTVTAREPLGCVRLGETVFDAADGVVWVEGRRVQLSPRLAALLEQLVRSAPRTVSKEDFLDEVWEGSIVSEAALTQRIKELRAVLGDDARHPRYIETVARRGYRLIAPVSPGVAPPLATAAEAPATAAPLGPSPGQPAQAWRRRWAWGLAGGGALILAGAALLWSVGGRHQMAPAGAAFSVRRSVAILGFSNLATRPEDEWLDEAFRHLLATEISVSGRLRVASGEVVHRVRQEFALAPSGPLAAETARRVGRAAGVDLLLTGSFLVEGEGSSARLRLDVALQETGQGEPLSTLAVSRPAGEFLALVDETGARLREALGLPPLSAPEREALAALLPVSEEAARFHAQGVIALRRFNVTGALEAFQRAVSVDPASAVAHAALADAWEWAGYQERAREASRLAWQLAGRLPREAQLVAEQGYRERLGDWPRAAEVARALWEFFPDNLDYGLSLVSVLAKSGADYQATLVLTALRALPPPLGGDPRLDLAEAWMADANPDRKLAAAERAAAAAELSGARLLLAAARVQQGMAQRAKGDLVAARAAFEEARRIRVAAGDAWGVAKVLEHLASLAHDAGDVAAAAASCAEALAIARAAGAEAHSARLLAQLARTTLAAGDLASARAALNDARQALPVTGDAAMRRALDLESGFLALAENRTGEAVAIARRLLASPDRALKSPATARAALLLAQALAAGDATAEAASAAEEAVRAATDSGDASLALSAAIIQAQVGAASGDAGSALNQLKTIGDRAARYGFKPVELDALVAAGELYARRGDRHRARGVLVEATRRARACGLLLAARRAEGLLAAL